MQTIRGKIFVLFFGVLFGCIMLELAAALYIRISGLDGKLRYIEKREGHYDQAKIGCHDKELGWGFVPLSQAEVVTSEFNVSYSINSKGLRDKEFKPEFGKNKFRIIVLGESNVFGQGVAYGERFSEIIEDHLRDCEVLNMGVWGYGMDQAYLQLRRDGFEYKPNLVVLCAIGDFLLRCRYYMHNAGYKPLFVLNDKQDDLILLYPEEVKKIFAIHIPGADNNYVLKNNARKDFLKKSKFFALVKYIILKKNIEAELENQEKNYWKAISERGFYKTTTTVDNDNEYLSRFIYILLQRLKLICDENKTDFLIVNIDRSGIHYLADFCRILGIHYLDLSGSLNNAAKQNDLQFKIDPHYNGFAHKIIGEKLVRYLKENYVLGNDSRARGFDVN